MVNIVTVFENKISLDAVQIYLGYRCKDKLQLVTAGMKICTSGRCM